MNDDDFLNACAMLAMLGWAMNGDFHEDEIPHKAWRLAHKMLEAKHYKDEPEEEGIVAIKKRKYVRKS